MEEGFEGEWLSLKEVEFIRDLIGGTETLLWGDLASFYDLTTHDVYTLYRKLNDAAREMS